MGDTYNIAVIGAGNIGIRYIENSLLLQREFVKEENKTQIGNIFFSRQSSKGVQDTHSRLEKIVNDVSAKERDGIVGFSDYLEMLRHAKTISGCKLIVVIASLYKHHYQHLKEALQIQPHAILCEKPLCDLKDIHKTARLERMLKNTDIKIRYCSEDLKYAEADSKRAPSKTASAKVQRLQKKHKKLTRRKTDVYVNQQIALADWYLENTNQVYKQLKDNCETASITWICPNKANYEGEFSQEDLALNLISHPRSFYIGTKLKIIKELKIDEPNQTISLTASVQPVLDSSNRTLKELNMTVGYGAKQCRIEFCDNSQEPGIKHIFEFSAGTNPSTGQFTQKIEYRAINMDSNVILAKGTTWLKEDLLKMTLRKIITGETKGLVDLTAARATMSDIAMVMDKAGQYRTEEYKETLKAKKESTPQRIKQNPQEKKTELSGLVNV